MDSTQFVMVKDAAAIWGVSVTTARRWVDKGKVPHVRTPMGRMMTREAVERHAATLPKGESGE